MSSAELDAATDAAAASIVPIKHVRIDLVRLKYSPTVRDVKGRSIVKDVIHGVTTAFVPYTVSALMGPSGSGKTSLLNVVAGFVDRAKHVKGDILVNGEGGNKPTPKKLVGIVFQDDMMLPALTVFETIKFAADLRMSRGASEGERRAACEAILAQLGLTQVKDTLVGGAARRGISGGERKRLAVGVELVTRPALLLMDEPTSGLDAAAALSLMRVLRALARRGQTVVAAIHQPRTTVFDAFDHLVLLSRGHTIYDGRPADCVAHLEVRGVIRNQLRGVDPPLLAQVHYLKGNRAGVLNPRTHPFEGKPGFKVCAFKAYRVICSFDEALRGGRRGFIPAAPAD